MFLNDKERARQRRRAAMEVLSISASCVSLVFSIVALIVCLN